MNKFDWLLMLRKAEPGQAGWRSFHGGRNPIEPGSPTIRLRQISWHLFLLETCSLLFPLLTTLSIDIRFPLACFFFFGISFSSPLSLDTSFSYPIFPWHLLTSLSFVISWAWQLFSPSKPLLSDLLYPQGFYIFSSFPSSLLFSMFCIF